MTTTITTTRQRDHLTATRRRAIRLMLDQNITAGRVGRIIYRLTATGDDHYLVTMEEQETDGYGRTSTRIQTSDIRVTH